MTELNLVVEVRSVYGTEKIYPVNDKAKLLASLAGTKTLSVANLELAKKLGFTVEQKEAYKLLLAA